MRGFSERIIALTRSNLGLKALALIIAVGLWFSGHRDIERAIEVPVEFRNIPSDLMVMENRVDYVVLRLMGPRTLVSTLDSDDMKLALDLEGARSGPASYPLSGASFSIPRGVSVARITPPVIHLRLEPLMKKTLTVALRFSNKPPNGYQVTGTTILPKTVSVQGPADEVRRLNSADTIPIEIEETQEPVRRRVRVSTDGKPLTFTPDQVDVVYAIEPEEMARDFNDVVVRAKNFYGEYKLTPQTVTIRLTGPRPIVENLTVGAELVYVILKGLPVGTHSVPLLFDLPAGVKSAASNRQQVQVRIIKPAA